MLPTARLMLVLLLSTLLIACGGGGGGGGGGGDDSGTSNSSNSQNTNNSSPPSSSDTEASNRPVNGSSQTITISWIAPSTRENGDPLLPSEISGYEIYYFQDGSAEETGETIAISDPNILEIQTPPLSSGTYYFAIATIDTQGIYSDTSDYVQIDID